VVGGYKKERPKFLRRLVAKEKSRLKSQDATSKETNIPCREAQFGVLTSAAFSMLRQRGLRC
jgi:hypothetical protein